jgi:NADH-quinone oxidoreductase subunit C
MEPAQIIERVKAQFGAAVRDAKAGSPDPFVLVDPEQVVAIGRFLRDTPELDFKSLMCLSGVDYGDRLGVVYHLHSFTHRHRFCIKADLPREAAALPSVTSVWAAANWHEREAYDLLGIRFDGHPDLRRILLPDDWEGHPLRKDYQFPRQWRDIPI